MDFSCIFFLNASGQKFSQLAKTPPMGWNSWNKYGCEGLNETMWSHKLFTAALELNRERRRIDIDYEK